MNTNSNYIFRGFSLIAMAVLAFAMDAEVRMPAFFSDNMVLQRDTDVRLWGEAKPNTTVRTIRPIPARTANGAFRFPPHMLEDLTL